MTRNSVSCVLIKLAALVMKENFVENYDPVNQLKLETASVVENIDRNSDTKISTEDDIKILTETIFHREALMIYCCRSLISRRRTTFPCRRISPRWRRRCLRSQPLPYHPFGSSTLALSSEDLLPPILSVPTVKKDQAFNHLPEDYIDTLFPKKEDPTKPPKKEQAWISWPVIG